MLRLGVLLRGIRGGRSLAYAAAKTGLSKSFICNVELGRQLASRSSIFRICEAFGADPQSFVALAELALVERWRDGDADGRTCGGR